MCSLRNEVQIQATNNFKSHISAGRIRKLLKLGCLGESDLQSLWEIRSQTIHQQHVEESPGGRPPSSLKPRKTPVRLFREGPVVGESSGEGLLKSQWRVQLQGKHLFNRPVRLHQLASRESEPEGIRSVMS